MRKILLFLGVCLLLGGCRAVTEQPVHPVVASVTIDVEDGGEAETLSFHTDEETSNVLDYLRKLSPGAVAPVNPEYVTGPMYTFTVFYSDGTAEILRQKDTRYFMGSDGVWKTIGAFPRAKFAEITAFITAKTRTF